MKNISRSLPLMAAALLVGSAVSAHADTTPGWYAGAGGGVDFRGESSTASFGNRDIKFHDGYNANINGGYAFDNGFRAEGELSHSYNNVKSAQGSNGSSGSLSDNLAFLNGYYDWNIARTTGMQSLSMFTPYVGVGVGVNFPVASNVGPTADTTALDGSSLQLAYQGIAGVAAQLDYNWAVTADYRYVASPDPRFNTKSGFHGRMEDQSQNIVVGVRYSFGQPQPAPMQHTAVPAPYHAPAAKPMVAPVAQSYQVFFDFNKAELTPEAKNIIASAAKDFRSGKYIRIVVTGHTDTVGSDKYNQALSAKRAKAVKAELIKQGVAIAAVKTQGVGKDGLMVPTANGVREAQNRRAEIVFEGK